MSGGAIVLAAGGTGGHMFPAAALARELERRGNGVALVTDGRGAGFGDATGAAIHRIAARHLGSGIGGKARGVATLCYGWLQARRLLARIQPAAAVGFGGYPTLPTMFAAIRAGTPSMIHEQNAVLGRANAALAPRVSAIATSFDRVEGVRAEDLSKLVRTGNPVRDAVAAVSGAPYQDPVSTGGGIALLVIGGSQGARVLSDRVPQAVAALDPTLRERLRVVQQARPEDVDRVGDAYRRIGVAAETRSFFEDLPARMARAALVISRAGASTIAELSVIGRPAILIPYFHAAAGHQERNAREIERCGGAWVMTEPDLAADALAARLETLLRTPGLLADASAAMRRWTIPDAASRLADRVEALARANGGAPRWAA